MIQKLIKNSQHCNIKLQNCQITTLIQTNQMYKVKETKFLNLMINLHQPKLIGAIEVIAKNKKGMLKLQHL